MIEHFTGWRFILAWIAAIAVSYLVVFGGGWLSVQLYRWVIE
jgi:hypothetical protein